MNSASALAKKRAILDRNARLLKLPGQARRALTVSLTLPERARPLAQDLVASMPDSLCRYLAPFVAGARTPADFLPNNRLLKALWLKVEERQSALMRRRIFESDAKSIPHIAAKYSLPPDVQKQLVTAMTKGNDAVKRIILEEGEAEQLLRAFRDAVSEDQCNPNKSPPT